LPSTALPFSRGRVMTNSVNTPGSVSTSILPPCCLTMMSLVIERPSPVPSPVGLVVKKRSRGSPLVAALHVPLYPDDRTSSVSAATSKKGPIPDQRAAANGSFGPLTQTYHLVFCSSASNSRLVSLPRSLTWPSVTLAMSAGRGLIRSRRALDARIR